MRFKIVGYNGCFRGAQDGGREGLALPLAGAMGFRIGSCYVVDLYNLKYYS